MTINRGSRRARGESWLDRITKGLGQFFVVQKEQGLYQADSDSEDLNKSLAAFEEREKQVSGTVRLKTGEVVEVKLGELKDYLRDNRDKIAPQRDPNMKPRKRAVKRRS
jgi:hypothetical protein